MKQYGMPYMGSKSGIAEKIIDVLPAAPVLYDLFGGGGAISHCAVLSGKWKKVKYNELNRSTFEGFHTAVNGGFNNETRWIGRGDFARLREYDPYVKICYSFGNDGRTYAYNKYIEPYKRALHYAVVHGDFALYLKLTGIDLAPELAGMNMEERRLAMRKVSMLNIDRIRKRVYSPTSAATFGTLDHLQRLNRLQGLSELQKLHKMHFFNGDYRDVPIMGQGIIYCDIPYENTAEYSDKDFNYDAFWQWVSWQQCPVYISSYEINRPDVVCVAVIPKRSTLSACTNNLVFERLYRYIGRI